MFPIHVTVARFNLFTEIVVIQHRILFEIYSYHKLPFVNNHRWDISWTCYICFHLGYVAYWFINICIHGSELWHWLINDDIVLKYGAYGKTDLAY